jgi:hypothetical protein
MINAGSQLCDAYSADWVHLDWYWFFYGTPGDWGHLAQDYACDTI